MCPVPFVFVLFLEQALERASLAGWQRGMAVSLPGHLGALWILLVMEHHRHLSGEQSEGVCDAAPGYVVLRCILHGNCVERVGREWETQAVKAAGTPR